MEAILFSASMFLEYVSRVYMTGFGDDLMYTYDLITNQVMMFIFDTVFLNIG